MKPSIATSSVKPAELRNKTWKRIFILGSLILVMLIYSKLAEAQPDLTSAFKEHGIVLLNDATQYHISHDRPAHFAAVNCAGALADMDFIMIATRTAVERDYCKDPARFLK